MPDLNDSAAPAQDTSANQQQSQLAPPPAAEPSWRDTLPDELKASPVLAKYQDQTAAIKALVDAQDLIGKKTSGLVKPGPGAKPEEVAEFYKALGRPDTPDAYVMPKIEGIPEGYGISPDVEKIARESLHGLGLGQEQFDGAMKALVNHSLKEHQEKVAFRNAEATAFQAAHGDKAGTVLKTAEQAILTIGGEDLLKALNETEAVNRKVVMESFAKLAANLGEGGLKMGSPGASPTNLNELPPAERITAARAAGYK